MRHPIIDPPASVKSAGHSLASSLVAHHSKSEGSQNSVKSEKNSLDETGPLLRNHNLGGKFQKGDLIFDTRNISFYELLSKALYFLQDINSATRPLPTILPFIFVFGMGRGFMDGPGSEKTWAFCKVSFERYAKGAPI